MKKTFVTAMPDRTGAFLKASEFFACLKINITRVSYNKAVDTHTLFIEAEGTESQLEKATLMLKKIGYLHSEDVTSNVVLLEFRLEDKPGELLKVLRLIEKYGMNISYISSHENGLGYQPFRMGLFVNDENAFSEFLGHAAKICPVTEIQYNRTEVNFDNSIFYKTYVEQLSSDVGLNREMKDKLAVNVNRAMQILDEKNVSPKTTFDNIAKFAACLSSYRGNRFRPRITVYKITETSNITAIEPPCGSNTYILKSGNDFLFIDSGYSIYRDEMLEIFDRITGGFSKINKRVIVTHADVDHSGLLHLFDKVLVSDKSKECFELELLSKRDFRERNPLHLPYIRICKLLTGYAPPPAEKLEVICRTEDDSESSVYFSGIYEFGEFRFDIYCTQGGHLAGEIILIDRRNRIVFSGDVYVNVHGYTPEQEIYNRYAPILMTSVDTNPELAKIQRNALFNVLEPGVWHVFGGHGAEKDMEIKNKL